MLNNVNIYYTTLNNCVKNLVEIRIIESTINYFAGNDTCILTLTNMDYFFGGGGGVTQSVSVLELELIGVIVLNN